MTRTVFALCGAAVSGMACSSAGERDARLHPAIGADDASLGDALGRLSAELTLPAGRTIATVQYTLSNNAFSYAGSVDVSSSNVADLVIANVASGAGYTLVLRAPTTDGLVTCAGSATGLSVGGQLTTIINLNLQCTRVCAGGTPASPNTDAGTCAGTDSFGRPLVNRGTSNVQGDFCCVPPLGPCTASGQPNCVSCQGTADGSCSATEAAIVQRDVARGLASAPGPSPAGSCYACLLAARCLDDVTYADVGHECDDFPSGAVLGGDGGAGAGDDGGADAAADGEAGGGNDGGGDSGSGGAGKSERALCLATLSCVLDSHCAHLDGGDTTACYCGAGGGSASACAASTGTQNGACLTPEANGFAYPPTDALDIVTHFYDTAQPSGMANEVGSCALAAGCTQCAP